MKKLKTYFSFEGTVSGTAYAFRTLVFSLAVFCVIGLIEILLGEGAALLTRNDIAFVAQDADGIVAINVITMIVAWISIVWVGIATTVKRARALSIKYDTTANTLIIMFVPFGATWATFKDSLVKNHQG